MLLVKVLPIKAFIFICFGCAGSLLLRRLFSSCGVQELLSGCGVQASPCSGFSCCGVQALGGKGFSSCNSQALEHKLNICGTQA